MEKHLDAPKGAKKGLLRREPSLKVLVAKKKLKKVKKAIISPKKPAELGTSTASQVKLHKAKPGGTTKKPQQSLMDTYLQSGSSLSSEYYSLKFADDITGDFMESKSTLEENTKARSKGKGKRKQDVDDFIARREYAKSYKGVALSVKTCNWEAIKEHCRRIELLLDKCRSDTYTGKINKWKVITQLLLLITCSGIKTKIQDQMGHKGKTYLTRHKCLVYELVYIMAKAEDFQTCVSSVRILYSLIVKDTGFDLQDKVYLKKALRTPSVFKILLDSVLHIHYRFARNRDYKAAMQSLYAELLQVIAVACIATHCRKHLKNADEKIVEFIGYLTGLCHKSKELAVALMEILTIVIPKKANCCILASKSFFDGLCRCYHLTKRMLRIVAIFKIMSRPKPSVAYMSQNENVINLILDLLSLTRKKYLNKPALTKTLFRMSKHDVGVGLLSKPQMFHKLYQYFLRNEKHDDVNFRLSNIRVYSILNSSGEKVVLTNGTPEINGELPEDVRRCLSEQRLLDESNIENDDSEDDTQDEDEADEVENHPINPTVKEHPTTPNTVLEPLADMCPLFMEYMHGAGDSADSSTFKSKIFDGLTGVDDEKVIRSRVCRGTFLNSLAFPDAAMLDASFDDHVLNPSVNNFSVDRLANKVKHAKNPCQTKFTSRIVYDLDQLCCCFDSPSDIPQVGSFMPAVQREGAMFSSPPLRFESRFECGNLRKAVQINTYEYELLVSSDTNSTRGLQWYYFQVSNMVPDMAYTFNIANFLKYNSQYNHGMQPLMFSVTDYTLNGIGWVRVGSDIVYYGNHYVDEKSSVNYKTLSFTLKFRFSDDYVYFAYHYPYTYTRLMTKLHTIVNYKSSLVYIRLDKLCDTVGEKNEMPLLTITGAWERSGSLKIPFHKRPVVFLTARVHPSETNSSWIMEGMLKFLLDEADTNAIKARDHFVFKIIPMLNPEGVIYGNSRTGLIGTDLNRCWARPNKVLCPEIYYAKKLVACAKRELHLPIAVYMDVHGHSRKKFFFFYACNPRCSWNKEDKEMGDMHDLLKALPETVRGLNAYMQLSQCYYKIDKLRETTGRVVMWREFDIKHSYTLECSYSFVKSKQSINTRVLHEIGASVIAALGKMIDKAQLSKRFCASFALEGLLEYIKNSQKQYSAMVEFKKEDENANHTPRSLLDAQNVDANGPIFVNSIVVEKNMTN